MFVTETSHATEKQTVLDLKAALQKAEEEIRRVKEEAQLIREATKAEKKAAYQLGIQETEARLSEEIPEVCRDYYSISWAHALDAAGIPADSALRSRFSDPDRSLNRKRERFKVFEVEPRSNRGRIVITS